MTTKHQKILLEYITNANLEIIVQNSIRTLVQGDSLPDNPFGSLSRYFSHFAAKDDLTRCLKEVRTFQLNTLSRPEEYGIVRVEANNDVWGLPHLMHYINPQHIRILTTTLRESLIELRKNYNDNSIEVRISIGGGEIFKSPIMNYMELASAQLMIRADCLVDANSFEIGFEIFANFAYDDLMAIGSNNSFNLIQEFYIEQGANNNPKRLSFQHMLQNKQIFVSELKSATIQKRICYVKMYLFTKDLRKLGIKDIVRPITPSSYLVDKDAQVLDSFQYIYTKKYYIMHFKTLGSETYTAFEAVPLHSVYDCVYINPDSVRLYASLQYRPEQNPYNMDAIGIYNDYKREAMLQNFLREKPMNILWEAFTMSITHHEDSDYITLIEELQKIFYHKCAKMYRIKRINKSLRLLVNSYYDTNFDHFQRLAEGLFVLYKEEMLTCFGDSFSGEMLAAKEMVITMLDNISVNKSKTINLHSNTLKVLERLDSLCKAITKNTVEILIYQSSLISALISDVLKEYQINNPITRDILLDKKQTEKVVVVKQALKRLKVNKKDGLALVFCDYLTKTGVITALTKASQSVLMSYPLVPNPLKCFSLELMTGVSKYDMMQITNEEVLQDYCRFPEERDGHFAHVVSFTDSQEVQLLGSENILIVTAIEELGIFYLIFNAYKLTPNKMLESVPKNYNIKAAFSVCGQSVLNNSISDIQRTQWHIQYDVFIKGGSLNAATYAFIDIIIRYALWLQHSTDATVIGLFTPFSDEPLANFEDIVSLSGRKQTAGLLFSAYQMNNPVWMRFLIPFRGNAKIRVPLHVMSVHCYFSLHYQEGASGKILNLVPGSSLEELLKIFFDEDDISLYNYMKPYEFTDDELYDQIYQQIHSCKELGQHFRAFVYSMYIALLKREEEGTAIRLRINKTVCLMLIEAAEYTLALSDLVNVATVYQKKHNEEYMISAYEEYKNFLQSIILTERNVILESIQPSMLTVMREMDSLIRITDDLKYNKIVNYLKWIRNILKNQAIISMLLLERVIEESESK